MWIIIFIVIAVIIWIVIDKYYLTRSAPSRVKSHEPWQWMPFEFEDSKKTKGKYLIFDIETTGLPITKNAKPSDFANWPYVVQIAWGLFDDEGKAIEVNDYYIKQENKIPLDAIEIHGITNEIMQEKGIAPQIVYSKFNDALKRTKYLVSHNIEFDVPIVQSEFLRNGIVGAFDNKKTICTMKSSIEFCKIPRYSGGYKYPTLGELFQRCFFQDKGKIIFYNLHRANIDAGMTAKCFFRLKELNIIRD